MGDIGGLAERTIDIVRNVASHLRPAALNFGLLSALEWLVQDFTRMIGAQFHIESRDGPGSTVRIVFNETTENVNRLMPADNELR
ncbi:hypothetical protein [Paraburkholderia heleia]|uniref:hypothetical protein n=1 Tax=Paraburkholderia heleia TaxID=634127 RepID=UPI002AB76E02|nr:hypothetical protein [Paraburkholderia heleia]